MATAIQEASWSGVVQREIRTVDLRQSLSTTCAKRIASLHACCIICILLLCITSQAARLILKSSLHFTVHLFSDKCTVHLHIIQYCQLQDMRIDTKRLAVQGLQPPAPPLRPQEAFHGALFDVIYLTLQWELHLYFDALMRWPFFFLSLGALWCSGRRRSGQQFETGHEFGLETLEWWIKVRNNRCHRSRRICCSICSNRRCLSVYPVWMHQI